MSARSRQLGNNYVTAEDILNFVNDSDEENSSKGLIGEEGEAKELKNKIILKTGLVRDGKTEDKNDGFRIIDLLEINNQERESGRLNEPLEKWNEGSRDSSENKVNNSTSKQKSKENTPVIDYLLPSSNNNSEGNIISAGLKDTWSANKDLSKIKIEETIEGEISLFHIVRKRNSQANTLEVSLPKRLKAELDKGMTDAPAYIPLEIELALENNRRNEPIKRRNIKTMIEDLDQISRKWKDGYSRYKPSFRWGPPVIKNCSEKWDFHYFPQKIFEAYPKPLEGRSSQSRRIVETYEGCDSQSDVEPRSVRLETEKVDEEGSEALDYEQCIQFSGGSNHIEVDMNLFNSDDRVKMILRSSSQGRNRQDEGISNDVGMSEQSSKEKTSKKASFKANKDNKKLINANRQLVVQLERCRDPHRQYQNEESLDSNKNVEDITGKFEDYDGSSQMNSNQSHYEDNSAQAPIMNEDDQVACPICEKKFEKDHIVTHANHCATKNFRD